MKYSSFFPDPRAVVIASLAFCTVIAAPIVSMAGPETAGLPEKQIVTATADEVTALETASQAVLESLVASSEVARKYAEKAAGILVFPEVKTRSFLIGTTNAYGTLWKGGVVAGYYRVQRASLGLQVGSETSSRVFMIMTPKAVESFETATMAVFGAAGASVVGVDPATGELDGKANADIASFVVSKDGKNRGFAIKNMEIQRIAFQN